MKQISQMLCREIRVAIELLFLQSFINVSIDSFAAFSINAVAVGGVRPGWNNDECINYRGEKYNS